MDVRAIELRRYQRRQHGLFSLRQALECGYSRPAVRRRLSSATWDELDTRVYRIATGIAPHDRQRVMARTIATGGVASGSAAAALWGLMPFPSEVHVTVARARRGARHPGLHSSRALPAVDVTTCDGIPATTPVRTLIDIAAVVPLDRCEEIIDTAIVTGVVRARRLDARARELWTPRRSGCAIVLQLLEARHPELARARSVLEAHALRACDRLGIPRARVNYRVVTGGETRFIDLAWPDTMVAVELDGFVPHSTRRVFDDDRVRQNNLVADGWTVFRLTRTALDRGASGALAPVLAVLEERWAAL